MPCFKSIPENTQQYNRCWFFLLILCLCLAGNVQAQPDYQFKSESLISGTALQVNAVYKFPNVRTGTDARVKITAITGGISITDIDGPGGFDKALQPVIYVPAQTNGYIELEISFYIAGTAIPLLQAEVTTTPIDVDGVRYSSLPIYEFDQIQQIVGFTEFQFGGGELDMSFDGLWVTGKNNAAINYDDIDTLEKKVMFSTINAAVLSYKVRVGADNQSNTSTERLRSIYFQKFIYPNVVTLAEGPSVIFSGQQKTNLAKLSGNVISQGTNCRLEIERADIPGQFRKIGELSVAANGNNAVPFTYTDSEPLKELAYYRIKMFAEDATLMHTSMQVMVKGVPKNKNEFSIDKLFYAGGSLHMSVQSDNAREAWLNILDISGRRIASKKQFLSKGNNAIAVSANFSTSGKLIIVSVADAEGNSSSQKIKL